MSTPVPVPASEAKREVIGQLLESGGAAPSSASAASADPVIDGNQAWESARRELELGRLRSEAELAATEQHDIIAMRGRWSKIILWTIVGINVLDAVVVICSGLGWLHYDQGLTVPLFVADSLLKTLGLAAIIVAFLFNKSSVIGGKGQ
jgi:hypothetical protein